MRNAKCEMRNAKLKMHKKIRHQNDAGFFLYMLTS